MSSRSLSDLLDSTRAKVEAWLAECPTAISQPVFLVCTFRSQAEQDSLWAKGRTTTGPKVTWTRRSKHTERRAVDFALRQPKPFDLKADYDHDEIPDYTEVGKLAEKYGLQWGIVGPTGKHKDLGHLQDNENYKETV